MSKLFKIVVCASGGGGNFQAIIDARLLLNIEIVLLIVDRECGAIDRAKISNIPFIQINGKKGSEQFVSAMNDAIPECADLIVCAGFMPIIPEPICKKWEGKIINTHPSVLPKYGGKGMFGVKVQEAVMREKEKLAGCTVHYVNADIDGGEIILQKSIPVDYCETPWQLGGRVFKEENKLLIEAIRLIKNKIK